MKSLEFYRASDFSKYEMSFGNPSIRGHLEAQYLINLPSDFALDPTLLQSINVSHSESLFSSQPPPCHAGFCQEGSHPGWYCLWVCQEFCNFYSYYEKTTTTTTTTKTPRPQKQTTKQKTNSNKQTKTNQKKDQNKCHFSELSSRLLWPMLQFLVLYLFCFWPLRKAILSCHKTSKVQWTVSDGHGSVLTLVKLISRDWKWYCLSFFFGDTKTSSVWVPESLKRMDGFQLIFRVL